MDKVVEIPLPKTITLTEESYAKAVSQAMDKLMEDAREKGDGHIGMALMMTGLLFQAELHSVLFPKEAAEA